MARSSRPACSSLRSAGHAEAFARAATLRRLIGVAGALMATLGAPGGGAALGASSPVEEAPTFTHTLRAGETIWALSQRYGVPVASIVERNAIDDVRRLPVGQRIVIPTRGSARFPSRARSSGPEPVSVPVAGQRSGERAQATPLPSGRAHDFAELDARLTEARRSLRTARFKEALAALDEIRAPLRELPPSTAASRRISELEILAATCEVALGRHGDALLSFGRALEATPALRLDARHHSPKVVRVFEEARARRAPHAAARPVPSKAGSLRQ